MARLIDAEGLKASFESVMGEEPIALRQIVSMIDSMPTMTVGARDERERALFRLIQGYIDQARWNQQEKRPVSWALHRVAELLDKLPEVDDGKSGAQEEEKVKE